MKIQDTNARDIGYMDDELYTGREFQFLYYPFFDGLVLFKYN